MKKPYNKRYTVMLRAALIFCIFMAIAVIPLNLFLLQLPEWISIVLSFFVAVFLVVTWIKGKGKATGKIVLSVLGIIAIIFSLLGSYCNPYWNSVSFKSNVDWLCKNQDSELTYEQASEDLDYAMKYLEKLHPAFYDGVPERLQEQYELASAYFQQADVITVNDVAQQIQAIFYLLGDAHTNITVNFPDERYMKYIYKHREAEHLLKGINGQTWEQMLGSDSPAYNKVSYEVKEYGIERLRQYVNSLQGLSYLGISAEDGIVYNYETESGQKADQYVEEKDFLPYDEYMNFNGIEEEEGSEADDFVYYEIDEKRNAAALTLYSCTYNKQYKDTVRNMFKEVKEKGIKNVAVDLRNNGGGDSRVANEFLKYIDVASYKEWACDWRLGPFKVVISQREKQNSRYEDLLFQGNLYVLTSVYTFSSAMNFAEYVKDNGLGTIIGEASGNAPDSYGDISLFKLPNSGIIMQVSTKKWYRTDNKSGLIEPDIPCDEWEALDYFYKECEKKM